MATYRNEAISAGGHRGHFCRWPQKNTDLRNCSHLSKHCTKPASLRTRCAQGGHHFQIDVPKVGLISKLMCPRWASFSNSKLAGHIQRKKHRSNCRGNELFFCVSFFLYFSSSIAVGLMRSILSLRIFTSLPGSRLRFFIAIKFSTY